MNMILIFGRQIYHWIHYLLTDYRRRAIWYAILLRLIYRPTIVVVVIIITIHTVDACRL